MNYTHDGTRKLQMALYKIDHLFYEYNSEFEGIIFNETYDSDFKRYTINTHFDVLSKTIFADGGYKRFSIGCIYMNYKKKQITFFIEREFVNSYQEIINVESVSVDCEYKYKLTKKNIFEHALKVLGEFKWKWKNT